MMSTCNALGIAVACAEPPEQDRADGLGSRFWEAIPSSRNRAEVPETRPITPLHKHTKPPLTRKTSWGADGAVAGPSRPLSPETVCEEYAPRVYSVAWRMLANDADAEDVTQDVLLQVVRKLDTFRGESSLATWLHRITVNAALAHRRKAAQRKERQLEDPMDQFLADGSPSRPQRACSGPADKIVLGRELRQLIDRAIAGLPQMYREVYILADIEDYPNARIGAELGLSLPAVKSRLHRARMMMRDALAPHFGEARG
jgi:RNA polymerase sigma-70 factor (ECF subfamily)